MRSVLYAFFWDPDSVVDDCDVSNWVSENLDENDDEFRDSRVNFSLIFKICSHDLNDKSKKEYENEENGEKWNKIEENRSHHLNQESKIVNDSDILHDFDDWLTKADDWHNIVDQV